MANMTDIAPRQGGKVFGICNTFGGVAGVLGVTTAGQLLDAGAGYSAVFGIMVAMYLVGTLVWNLWCTDHP